jgi:hypothetical protein
MVVYPSQPFFLLTSSQHEIDNNLHNAVMARAGAILAPQPRAATRAIPANSGNRRGQPLVDFHLFANLAPELQDAIWECESSPADHLLILEIDHSLIQRQFPVIRLPKSFPYSSAIAPSDSSSDMHLRFRLSFTQPQELELLGFVISP